MRIAFVSWRDLAHPQAGGAEVVLDHLAVGLRDRGHDVALVSGGPVATRPYRVIRNGGTYSQYVEAPLTFWRHARGVDVVVDVENGIPFFSPLWQRSPVVCLVHHVHTDQWSMQFPPAVAAIGRWLEVRAMPRVYRRALFVAVSESTRQGLVQLGVDDARIRTVVMGSDSCIGIGPRSDTPRFLVLGRLVPHKRVALALQMWDQVRPRTGGQLVIVGDGPARPELERAAGPDVVFLGHLPPERKARELGAAWLLVHPAHHEGWGTVVMEAAGSGMPTIGFDVPGLRDSVVDGTTGLLARDERSFVDAWIRLACDSAARDQMAQAALQRAASYPWARAITEFEACLREAAGR
jgi:glycosyltransferase involved in cell wall biosynthesis